MIDDRLEDRMALGYLLIDTASTTMALSIEAIYQSYQRNNETSSSSNKFIKFILPAPDVLTSFDHHGVRYLRLQLFG
jgi:hypothetical protein